MRQFDLDKQVQTIDTLVVVECRRLMFGVGAVLSIIQAAAVLPLPPSPRFYVLRNKYTEVCTAAADQSNSNDMNGRTNTVFTHYNIASKPVRLMHLAIIDRTV